MKFDVNVMRHLGHDDFRTLQAVEIGQKNVSEKEKMEEGIRLHNVDGG